MEFKEVQKLTYEEWQHIIEGILSSIPKQKFRLEQLRDRGGVLYKPC